MELHRYFAPCAKGLETLLADELRALGITSLKETLAGVAFSATLAEGYRACLWSRLASRVVLQLVTQPCDSAQDLYDAVQTIDWSEHLAPSGTFAVDFSGTSRALAHTHFGALKTKDAIVDQFRRQHAERPNVDVDQPDVRVNVHLDRGHAIPAVTIGIDLAGTTLHHRGYRVATVKAPLKENLACAVLLRAGWPAVAAQGGSLLDPLCGSGTLLIEGACMAVDSAPGLQRETWGFLHWRGHDEDLWQGLLEEARERRAAGLSRLPVLIGYDADPQAIASAKANIKHAGLGNLIKVAVRALTDGTAENAPPGLIVTNPPYGERLGAEEGLPALYAALGQQWRTHFTGWRAALLTGNPPLGKRVGLHAVKMHALYNGAMACKLLHFDLQPQHYIAERPVEQRPLSASAQMLANRLRKNIQHLRRWAERENITCYRVYDADLPEYNIAVDLYQGDERWAHVQEYQAPASVDARQSSTRLRDAVRVVAEVLELSPEHISLKVRQRQRGQAQYEKVAHTGHFFKVMEYPCELWVNLTDYLDTGLFLDHRLTRARLGALAANKHVLNLFAYTAAASVHAALGGAASTLSVDLSNTYLDWAERNFALNDLDPAHHRLVRADVLQWIQEYKGRLFDVIFLDPPTFSRSKRMSGTLDIQRDHVALIQQTLTLLRPDGVLLFSTNHQRFKLDTAALGMLQVEDISAATLPPDFARHPKIHRSYLLRRAV